MLANRGQFSTNVNLVANPTSSDFGERRAAAAAGQVSGALFAEPVASAELEAAAIKWAACLHVDAIRLAGMRKPTSGQESIASEAISEELLYEAANLVAASAVASINNLRFPALASFFLLLLLLGQFLASCFRPRFDGGGARC